MFYPQSKKVITFILLILSIVFGNNSFAQDNRMFLNDRTIDPSETRELTLEFDGAPFFKNNEFKGNFIKGYSLPGFNMEIKAVYQPTDKVRLEAGAYVLRFWGAEKYPSLAYSDIAQWKGDQYQKGLHLLPLLRVHFNLGKGLDIVAGNLYGRANHNLILPLYNPELNLISDPEAGIQLLYTSRYFDSDLWINWESFIFDESDHQEAFTVGFSSQLRANRKDAPLHIYFPIQTVIQHRGGEIDTSDRSVQTLVNASAGVGGRWNTGYHTFKNLSLEVHALGFYQQKGGVTSFNKGAGFYAQAAADISSFQIKTGYWQAGDFASLLGSPFFGTVSLSEENYYFQGTKMIYAGAGFLKSLGKGYSMGIDIDIYHHFDTNAKTTTGIIPEKGSTSFSAGIYFRINPSLLLKKFQ